MGVFAVLLASVLWGTTGTAASFAQGLSPLAIGAFAMGVAALLLGLRSARSLAKYAKSLSSKPLLLLAGATSVVCYPLAFYSSMHLAGVAIGTVVSIASAPLFAALLERLMDAKPITLRWTLSFLVGVIGIALLYLGKVTPAEEAGGSAMLFGVILGLVAGLAYSAYTWVVKRHIESGIESGASMAALFLLASLVLLPSLVITGENLFATFNNAAVVIYMAIVPMFLGYLAFAYGLRTVSASSATLITLVEPVVAVLLAIALLGEQFALIGWLGLAAVFLSILIQLR